MAIEIVYTEDCRGGVELLISGTVIGQDIVEALKQVYADKRFGRAKYLLADKTNCTEYTVEPDDVRRIAALDVESAQINPGLIEAHVAPNDILFGTSRMWQAYVSEGRTTSHIFRDRESAIEWINSELDQKG
jgi:hypothetical protein